MVCELIPLLRTLPCLDFTIQSYDLSTQTITEKAVLLRIRPVVRQLCKRETFFAKLKISA
jgi:hypothetical protein